MMSKSDHHSSAPCQKIRAIAFRLKREAFIRVVNSLITDRKEVLTELRSVRDMLTGTEKLEKEQRKLAEQMNAYADAVRNLIAENARVAQSQEECTIR